MHNKIAVFKRFVSQFDGGGLAAMGGALARWRSPPCGGVVPALPSVGSQANISAVLIGRALTILLCTKFGIALQQFHD